MTISEEHIAAVKVFEGFRASAYRDAKGVWTVGYGWTLGVKPSTVMTEKLADTLLRGRMTAIAQHLASAVRVPLTQWQFDALCDFEYNLGRGALDESTLLRLLNQGRFIEAAREFPRWVHAGDKVLPGLVKRRLTEQSWFAAAAA